MMISVYLITVYIISDTREVSGVEERVDVPGDTDLHDFAHF